MWTPKRVLLLAAGLAVFITAYSGYAFFLGKWDGMPPLPQELLCPENKGPVTPPPPEESEIDKKLSIAFGLHCPQLKQRVKFEVRKKGMVVAASEASFKEPDGRIRLTDFSLALFKEDADAHDDSKWPDINTITSDVAFLSFADDHGPIKIESPTDVSKGKISAAELRGHIRIINNRQTATPTDDLEVMVDEQPLFYDERTAMIWSNGVVHMIDKQSQPNPATVDGQGLELHLATEKAGAKQPTPAHGKKLKNDLNGVESIMLKSAVVMHLYPDASSGFMAGSDKSPPKDAKKGPPEKSHVKITTNGPFVYEVAKDVAKFAKPLDKTTPAFPDQIEILREPARSKSDEKTTDLIDHLYCDDLMLKFRRHIDSPAAPKGDKSSTNSREIEAAHATARPGGEVVLSLESENLACFDCQELIYQAPTAERGARTVLRGESLNAAKDGHKIMAKEIMLASVDGKGAGQQMVAQGPGRVDLWDKSPDTVKGGDAVKGYTTHATWNGTLTQTKVKDGDRDQDMLTLTDNAQFIDDEHGQKLSGQRLQVWLDSGRAPDKAIPVEAKPGEAPDGPRQKPVKVEAYDNVKADSPEFGISYCVHLLIRFKDAVAPAGVLPGAVVPGAPGALPAAKLPGQQAPSAAPGQATPPSSGPLNFGISQSVPESKSKDKDKDKAKTKKPMDLRARDIIVDVLRGAEKNELQELVAVGNVHVHQDGEKPEDKGVDIVGDMLNLLHYVEGDIIKVFGNASEPAQLQLQDLYLVGPKVTIDQKGNTANVDGAGVMSMPSNTTFGGDKPAKAGTRLTVRWSRDMIFDGRDAEFYGVGDGNDVTAYQDDSTLQCQSLTVTLDHRVSLKEGEKGDQKAKVDKLLAHNKVCILENTKDDKGRPQVQRLLCHEVQGDNLENLVNAYGPGQATALQYETPGEMDGDKSPKQAKAPTRPPVLTLTRINFQERMFSTQLNPTTRKSIFLGNVYILHVVATSLDAQVEPDKLPKDGILLSCDRLTVFEKKEAEGKKSQTMLAEGRVFCRGNEMSARAEAVTFDKNQETMIFTGSPGNPAILYRQVGGPGSQLQKSEGLTIKYNRKNNTATADGVTGISGRLEPEERLGKPEALETETCPLLE